MNARTLNFKVVSVARVHPQKIIYFYYIFWLNEYFMLFVERNGDVDEYILDIQVSIHLLRGTRPAFNFTSALHPQLTLDLLLILGS